jgi:hypothetical protein
VTPIPRWIPRRDPAEVTVQVYHHCPAGASGTVLGPFEDSGYWWVDGTGIRVVSAYPHPANRAAQEAAIIAELLPADGARRAQDARAEAPDL